jgi:hypothetical protein
LTGPSGSSDFCIWRPSSSRTVERLIGPDPESVALYSLATASKTAQSPTAVAFRLKTLTGQPLGTLECYFPRADSPATISFDRWVTTVGAHITLEVRR